MILGIVSYVILALVALLIVLCVVTALTGHCRRAYEVLPKDAIVTLMGKEVALEELASRYRPVILLRPDTPSPPGTVMWYEVIQDQESFIIVYHPAWENEVHPQSLIHAWYSAFRAIYYGRPLWDIEYIQLNVNSSNGHIERVRYESGPLDDYYSQLSIHHLVYVDRIDSQYVEMVLDRAGKLVRKVQDFSLATLDDSVLRFGVLNWSHQLTLLGPEQHKYNVVTDMSLEYLSEREYEKRKMCRRSQGDYVTGENRLSSSVSAVVRFLFVDLPALLIGLAADK